jgi:hypothetical protein
MNHCSLDNGDPHRIWRLIQIIRITRRRWNSRNLDVRDTRNNDSQGHDRGKLDVDKKGDPPRNWPSPLLTGK